MADRATPAGAVAARVSRVGWVIGAAMSTPPPADALAAHLGFATLDLGRLRRTGHPEVIFGQGKTAGQIAALLQALHAAGQEALATRVDPEKADAALLLTPGAVYHPLARCLHLPAPQPPPRLGNITVVCAGTSDLPVAEEAALVAEILGNRVVRIHDVGVAGLHRLLARLDDLRAARVIVAVAGMEGALPSVLGGLVDKPVIAVPTSVGYGANLGGLSALLSMLNSCAAGVSVVNIDNGFGAAAQASLINHMGAADDAR